MHPAALTAGWKRPRTTCNEPPRPLTTRRFLPTLRAPRGDLPPGAAPSGPQSLPPHRRTGGVGGAATPPRARGPLSASRKIHLYGETKKSTHGHPAQPPTHPGRRRRRGKRPCRTGLPYTRLPPHARAPRPKPPSPRGLPYTRRPPEDSATLSRPESPP